VLVGLSFTVAFALGVSGFLVEGYDLSDSVYRAIGLFILQGGESTKSVWQIEVARFLAPITLSTATIRGAVALARSNFGVIGGHLFGSGHLILVADDSDTNRGILGLAVLARSTSYLAGRDLVLVSPDADNLGRALRIAGVKRCSELVVSLGTDEGTLATVHRIHSLLASSDGHATLPIRAEIDSWRVWSELQRVDFAGGSGTTWFNRDEVAAQMICKSLRDTSVTGGALCSADPEITTLVLRAEDVDASTFDLEPTDSRMADLGLVCHRSADRTLEGATELAARIKPSGFLTAVCSGELAEAVERIGAGSRLTVRTIDPADWMAPWVEVTAQEMVARVVHEHFRSAGWHDASDPANRQWDDLPEQLKESSRAAARAISRKLEARGLAIRPSKPGIDNPFEFSLEEVEELAVSEHERWCRERSAAGWKAGVRDIEAMTTPNLIPWEELPEIEREKDRELVMAIPSWLRKFGYEIHR
jgi:hypothetical protein